VIALDRSWLLVGVGCWIASHCYSLIVGVCDIVRCPTVCGCLFELSVRLLVVDM
jgi:hypothetical protein